MALHEAQKARSAGASERYLISRSHLGIYNSVGLTIGYSRTRKEDSVSAVPFQSIVHLAVTKAIAENPCLSFVPAGEETNDPYYVRLRTINLDHAISFIKRRAPCGDDEDLEIDELLQEQHNRPFQHSHTDTPYWRLLILRPPGDSLHFVAAFIFHHSICDTRSALLFHQNFTEAFTRAEAELQTSSAQPNHLVTTSEVAMPPSIESLISFSLSPTFKRTFISGAQNPTPVPDHVWTGEPAFLPVRTRFQSLCISASATGRLVGACKENETTVTAALQTAAASVLFSLLPPTFTTLNCDGAISLRYLLPNPPISSSTMGVFVRPFSDHYQREGLSGRGGNSPGDVDGFSPSRHSTASSFWSEARRSRQHLKKILAEPTTDNALFVITLLPEMDVSLDEYMLSKMGKKRPVSYEVSNIGTVVLRDQLDTEEGARALEMGRAVFSQSAAASSTPLKISVVTGGDGRLNLGFAWQVGSVSAAAGDRGQAEEKFVVEGLIGGVASFIGWLIGGVREMENQEKAATGKALAERHLLRKLV